MSLGSLPNVFDPAFASDPDSLTKLAHYPSRPPQVGGEQGVGSHKDSGVLTHLLLESASRGLQVQGLDGQWIDAPPVDGAFVVNIGEVLEVATDGYLRATPHRVLTPAGASPRTSIPFFFGPTLQARVPRLRLPVGLRAETHGISHDESNQLHSTYGDNMWKAKMRAHPEAFARWHTDTPRPAATTTHLRN
ncbi:2OG-Fe(II) oxygenase family protein [Rhodococcus globerulus]|uniref:2OG-Fe(II) oxygenase family protein n=1 Tax=Rhodococcus globerulus TaxID=33008 RepID=A0ABU4C4U6_RHOGO|nr:2OG-Fe(II) oxygenase family protein [Rhodococcus globerulus]MDV6271543.1 2OG-Fe(II) oxygenase family protein [Rhodococcus globerulus]